MRTSLLLFVLAASGCCCFGWSMLNGRLSGRVVDARTGQPIEGVEVHPVAYSYGRDGRGESLPAHVIGTTGADGRFAIEGLCQYPDRPIVFFLRGNQVHQIDPPFSADCFTDSQRDIRVGITLDNQQTQ